MTEKLSRLLLPDRPAFPTKMVQAGRRNRMNAQMKRTNAPLHNLLLFEQAGYAETAHRSPGCGHTRPDGQKQVMYYPAPAGQTAAGSGLRPRLYAGSQSEDEAPVSHRYSRCKR